MFDVVVNEQHYDKMNTNVVKKKKEEEKSAFNIILISYFIFHDLKGQNFNMYKLQGENIRLVTNFSFDPIHKLTVYCTVYVHIKYNSSNDYAISLSTYCMT